MNKQPDQQEIDGVLEKVSQIASMADFSVERHPHMSDMLVSGFDMGGGRRQGVYIRYVGESPEGQSCVSFMSPCMKVKKAGVLGGGLSRAKAVDLLRRNSQLAFGAYGLFDFESRDMVMVASNQIVETMEVEEFRAHMMCVAWAADEYERAQGQDVF